MRSQVLTYRVDPAQIHFLRFIYEAHDGIAVVRTLDPKQGLVTLTVPPGCLEDALAVAADLSRGIFLQPAPDAAV